MKIRKLELRKEIIATLNKSTMSGVWGGWAIVTNNTCASLKENLCDSKFCIPFTKAVTCEVKTQQVSLCQPCFPPTETRCESGLEACPSVNVICKMTEFC